MPKKKALQVEVEESPEEKDVAKEDIETLRTTLESINTQEGVVGYILRGSTSASVDLKDSSKIIDYAVLSATAFESSENFSKLFELGKISSIVVEGKDLKMLCMTIGEHRLSVFMDKTLNHSSIYKKLT